MKNINKTILIALGMALPLSVMASPDDDVTIRMMQANEHATQAVTRHIELPEAADDRAKEHAADGLQAANKNRNRNGDMDRDREHDLDGGDRDHEMEREMEREREMVREGEMDREREEYHERETGSDDRKDVEHDGQDREAMEHEGFDRGSDKSK